MLRKHSHVPAYTFQLYIYVYNNDDLMKIIIKFSFLSLYYLIYINLL